jgi:thioredoxin 1
MHTRRKGRALAATTLGQHNFESTIAGNDIVLVDFWASWCGPCRMFAPIYEKASEEHPDIVFGSVNTEEEQGLAAAAGITSIPTLMAFKDGSLVFAQPGALPAPALAELIEAVRGLDIAAARAEAARKDAASVGAETDAH